MSKSITIRAADSALAMEEVVRQLGPDALILSTSRKDGQFEIVAMVEEFSDAEQENPLSRRLKEALKSSPFKAGSRQAEPSPQELQEKVREFAADSPVAQTSASTFEALLKRRLEEDGVKAELSAPEDELKASIAAKLKELEQANAPNQAESARVQEEVKPKVAPQPIFRHEGVRRLSEKAAISEEDEALFTDAAKPAPAIQESPEDLRTQALAENPDLEFAPRVTGLGAFDIPAPILPAHMVTAFRDDLTHYDHSGNLIGLSKAIVSSLLPERAVEPLGAGRFWLAGPDMRQKALAAIRIAIRKLDAGEAKPSFYVMGAEARADAAFLASKAELLGLSVMLVDEKVGRNLPDNVPGSQIILLPDNPDRAKAYAQKFEHDGDKGLFILPSHYGREVLTPILSEWAEMDIQVLLTSTKYAPVSAGLLACLLQFNRQVAWTCDGEEVLDNLTQADAVTVTDWMRAWIPAEDAGVPAHVAAQEAPLFRSFALPTQ